MEFAPLSKDLNSLSDLRSREVKAILTVREKSGAWFLKGHLRWTLPCKTGNNIVKSQQRKDEQLFLCVCVSAIQCRSFKKMVN